MRIAIVGGGVSGLLTAWALEADHDVTLFEGSGRLGGHAETLTIEIDDVTRRVDAGAHFFNAWMHPRLCSLLRRFEVPVDSYTPTSTFWDRRDGFTVCMPPTGSLARCAPLTHARSWRALFALRRLVEGAIDLVENEGDFGIPLHAFVAALGLSREVRDAFVFPYLSAYWGVSAQEVRTYSARNVLSYLVFLRPALISPRPMLAVRGGLQTWTDRLVGALRRTIVVGSDPVVAIERARAGWTIRRSRGATVGFDHVVLATNAWQARALLQRVAGTERVREVLGGVEYFETRIAVHGDRSFMPPRRAHWSVVNCSFDGRFGAITNWEPGNRDVDLFRSWITHAEELPSPCYRQLRYWHPRPNAGYFAAQRELARHQGECGLWFAGVYTHGYDHHDSAIASAERVAAGLAPGSNRVRSLLDESDAAVGPSRA